MKQLSGEDRVVICFSLLGLLGSVAFYFLRMPSIIISIFLSAGITALVYRFLGGIKDASFGIGALKLGGTIAVLIGVAYWIDSTKQLNPEFHLLSPDTMVGEWQWDAAGPDAGWSGHLDFAKEKDHLTFTGDEYILEKAPQGSKNVPLLRLTNGKATLIKGSALTLESDVEEFQYGRKFHWKSVAPLAITPAFRGELRPQKTDDPNLESTPWGMLIYKKADR
jgi:hypothetical protein